MKIIEENEEKNEFIIEADDGILYRVLRLGMRRELKPVWVKMIFITDTIYIPFNIS